MNKYADVEKIQRLIIETGGRHSRNGEDIQTCSSICADLVTSIYQLPAADVVEVRHGYWIDDCYDQMDGGTYLITVCSVCGTPNPVSNYCPNCGAKMDEVMK